MDAETYIRRQIQRILSEGEDQKKEKKKKKPKRGRLHAKYGKGSHSAAVAGSKARVENDPSGLLGDLGAEMGKGNNDPQRILGLVRSAIYGTDVMAAAYVGANMVTRQDGTPIIQISTKVIKPRDGVYFMSHVMQSAENVGWLELEQNVTVEQGQGGVMISFDPIGKFGRGSRKKSRGKGMYNCKRR